MTKILHRWFRNPARKPVEVGSFLRLFTRGFYTSQVVSRISSNKFDQLFPDPHLNLSYRTQRMRNTVHPALHQMHQASCDVSNWDSFPNSGFVWNYGLLEKGAFFNDPKRQISRNIFWILLNESMSCFTPMRVQLKVQSNSTSFNFQVHKNTWELRHSQSLERRSGRL